MLNSAATAKHFEIASQPVPTCGDPVCMPCAAGTCPEAKEKALAPTTPPLMVRRPDRRLEVRHGDVVLMESPDAWKRPGLRPVVRIEAYRVDSSGLEMFLGYLNEAGTPGRAALLRLWMEAGTAALGGVRDSKEGR